MKTLRILITSMIIGGLFACGEGRDKKNSTQDSVEVTSKVEQVKETVTDEQMAEVGCANCQFEMECDECKLAVKIEDETYLVEGVGFDAFAQDDLCSMVKNAKVAGKIEKKIFKASKIELIADASETNDEKENLN